MRNNMKKIILLLISRFILIGVIKIVWEENQIERVYMINK